jgi:hypothetical protein
MYHPFCPCGYNLIRRDRYGPEIARLQQAEELAQRGYDIARRGGVYSDVVRDIKVSSSWSPLNHYSNAS